MQAISDPLIGAHIGSWVVEERLGGGAMGEVYRAVQPAIGKRVAIKFLAEGLNADAEAAMRFFHEARAVNLIGHQNIVDIFDFGRTRGGRNYLVMELLEGEPLEKVLAREGRLPVARIFDVARQLAR